MLIIITAPDKQAIINTKNNVKWNLDTNEPNDFEIELCGFFAVAIVLVPYRNINFNFTNLNAICSAAIYVTEHN